MKKQQSRSDSQFFKLMIGGICAVVAFAGWGFASSLIGSHPQPASVAKDGDASELLREQELSQAGGSKPKEGKSASVIFNDPFIQSKWGTDKISAARAWEVSKGSKDIVVAIIDTGVDINHKSLIENFWENPGETGVVTLAGCNAIKNTLSSSDFSHCKDTAAYCSAQKEPLKVTKCNKAINGIDDDGNGFVDDVHGWDFVHNAKELTDNHGHGTHIAGIIGARATSTSAVAGVSPNVSLMILKYYDPKSSNSNNLKNTVQAIRYATKMKANIINYSGGGTDYSAEEFAAIKDAEKAGILFIAAAGNERSNSDEAGKHYYPADYGLSNIISVTAVNKEDTKVLASSNYGTRTVDLAAPGENIYSTFPGGGFQMMTGTSQATAFVTGVAALIMAHNREFTAPDVKKYILRTGDEYPTLLSKTGSAKLLNSYKALTSLDTGVGLSGVIASNTGTVGARAFASDQDLKDPKLNTSALSASGSQSEEPTEAIAMFGKDFLKAVKNNDRAQNIQAKH